MAMHTIGSSSTTRIRAMPFRFDCAFCCSANPDSCCTLVSLSKMLFQLRRIPPPGNAREAALVHACGTAGTHCVVSGAAMVRPPATDRDGLARLHALERIVPGVSVLSTG